MNETFKEMFSMMIVFIVMASMIGFMFWFILHPTEISLENREQFCEDEGMRLSDNLDYCFDGFEKMYWIEPVGYGTWIWMEYERDFKLVKEVVTLE